MAADDAQDGRKPQTAPGEFGGEERIEDLLAGLFVYLLSNSTIWRKCCDRSREVARNRPLPA